MEVSAKLIIHLYRYGLVGSEFKTQIKINSLGFRDKESHTLKTGTERFFFALLRVTILNKELDIFKVEEKKVLHTINA